MRGRSSSARAAMSSITWCNAARGGARQAQARPPCVQSPCYLRTRMRAEQHTHVVHGEHLWSVVAVQVADELDGLGYQFQQLAAPQPRLLQGKADTHQRSFTRVAPRARVASMAAP
jgi:hypothetical protein